MKTILQVPEARLTQAAAPVCVFDDELKHLAQELSRFRQAHKGIGLAATQIGMMKRVISLNPGRTCGYATMVNPRIVRHGSERVTESEGCLSIDWGKTYFAVPRWRVIDVVFQTLDGEEKTVTAKALGARAIQHEIDHLDGLLINRFPRAVRRAA